MTRFRPQIGVNSESNATLSGLLEVMCSLSLETAQEIAEYLPGPPPEFLHFFLSEDDRLRNGLSSTGPGCWAWLPWRQEQGTSLFHSLATGQTSLLISILIC